MVTATRYHVNPSNQVKRCTAISAASCPFGEEAHFTGTKDQADFMQETLNSAAAASKRTSGAKSDYISLPFRDDYLRAHREADGKYTVSLMDGEVLEKHVELVGGDDAAGLKRWAVKDNPYQANKIELPAEADPKITELRAVFRTNADGALEHKGFIYKHANQDGWNAAHQLSELNGEAPVSGMGYFGAIKAAEKRDDAFHAQAKAHMNDLTAQMYYADNKEEELRVEAAQRAIRRNLGWNDRVYTVMPQLEGRVREAFWRDPNTPDGKQMPDNDDRVYIHEERDPNNQNRVSRINVHWGSRSWASRSRMFFSGETISAEKGLVDWLQEDVA